MKTSKPAENPVKRRVPVAFPLRFGILGRGLDTEPEGIRASHSKIPGTMGWVRYPEKVTPWTTDANL